jgi:hypothetical protein
VARDLGHGDADDGGTAGRRDQADEPEAADERESADEPGPAGGGGRHGA